MPGHPPCALISLIFSSLDPETNWSTLYVSFHSLLRCNWSFFRIILCAVVKVQAVSLRFVLISSFRFHLNGSLGNCSVFALANPENDTELLFANATDFLFDAVRPLLILRFLLQLLTFVSPAVL